MFEGFITPVNGEIKIESMHELMMVDDHKLMIGCMPSVQSWAFVEGAAWRGKQRKLG